MKTLVKVLVGLAIHLDINALLPAVFKLSMYLIKRSPAVSRLSLVDMVYQAQSSINRQEDYIIPASLADYMFNPSSTVCNLFMPASKISYLS